MPFETFLLTSEDNASCNWPEQAVLWVEALSKQQVLEELHSIMNDRNYSWHSINALLQSRLEQGDLDFTFEDGDVLFEWNNLCDEKRRWEVKGELSQDSDEFNQDSLINLLILPFVGGLGPESWLSSAFAFSS